MLTLEWRELVESVVVVVVRELQVVVAAAVGHKVFVATINVC
jgi:hypothetical protein